MTASPQARRHLVACVVTLCAALWCLGTLLPATHPLFSPVCHQNPQRSFAINGAAMSVCARCAGLYFGFLLGSLALICSMKREPHRTMAPPERAVLLKAALPVLAEGVAEFTGIWTGHPAARALTGALFGVVVPFFFIPAADEMLTEARAELSGLLIKLEKAHAITRAR